MIVIFGTHVYNDISSNFFLFFQIPDLFGFLERGRGLKSKKWPIITNFSLSHTISQEL